MKWNRDEMLSAFPESSTVFDNAVDRTLNRIRMEAVLAKESQRRRSYKRILAWGVIGALLLAGAFGIAEGVRLGVFDFLIGRETVLPQANELAQTNLAEMVAGHTTLQVTEAVYDAATIRLVMSVCNDAITRPLTEKEVNGDGAFDEALAKDGVTAQYSFDWFTIDGQKYGMTGGSGGQNVVGNQDGEMLIYFELLLTGSGGESIIAPTKDFTLGLPVITADTSDEMQLFIPIRYVAANLLKNAAPAAPAVMNEAGTAYTVTVTEAKLSPIRNAFELQVDVPDAANDDAAWACISPWYAIGLVDERGQELGRAEISYYGLPTDETDDSRHFCIRIEVAPQEGYPDRLFLAPMGYYGEKGEWTADMRLAIELKYDLEENAQ